MKDEHMSWADRSLSRRALLGAAGRRTLQAGALAVVGSAAWEVGARAWGAGGGPLPQLPASASRTVAGGAQVFRSRPDLHPPAIAIRAHKPGAAPGYVITESHSGPAYQGPLIIDGNGDLVWTLSLSKGTDTALRAFNVRAQQYRGKPVLCWFQGAVVYGHGQGHYVLYDGTYSQVAQVHGQNGLMGDLHEFIVTPEGTALFTCYGQATGDLSALGGAKDGAYFYGVAQEVDIATGKLLFQWDSRDHAALADSYLKPTDNGIWDYFHINCLAIDPSDGNLLISSRNCWTVYKVDRRSGQVMWRMGGKHSDYDVPSAARFAFQHSVTAWPNGTFTIFDNESGPPVEAHQSRALVLAVDQPGRKVSLLHQYDHAPPVLSMALGSVQLLPGGDYFVGWGETPDFTEYTPNGEVLFDGALTNGSTSYRAFKQPWQGRPLRRPDIAVSRQAKAATVYASWNGSTETAYWAVLGGASPAHLSPLGKAGRLGFETAITVPQAPAYLAVRAMSANGQVLGQSGTVTD